MKATGAIIDIRWVVGAQGTNAMICSKRVLACFLACSIYQSMLSCKQIHKRQLKNTCTYECTCMTTPDLTIRSLCVRTVIQNVDKLWTLIILALLYMYLQMVFAVFLIKDGINQDFCSNMFQCMQTMADITIRDYGVFDVLGYAEDVYRYPSNIIDSLGIHAEMREAGVYFIKKFFWDIPFQIFFAYVMISIVCGIIVDAFSSLKAEREEKEADLDTICFVCNLERWRLDQVSSMRSALAALPSLAGILCSQRSLQLEQPSA